MQVKVTIIIPYLNNSPEQLFILINKIILGKCWPNEILLAYSGKKKLNTPSVLKKKIKQKRITFRKIYKKQMYPGEARNIALAKCKNNIIGFLDLNTLPDKNWLYYGYKSIKEKCLIVWGQFYCEAISFTEKIIRASTLGSRVYKSIPGTILYKRVFKECGKFIENIRAGEDGDWQNRAYLHQIKNKANNNLLKYNGFKNKDFLQILKKWFTYYSHSKNLLHLKNQKNYYYWALTIVLILAAYNWNALIANWQVDSPKYIPNITKITFFLICSSYLFIRGIMLPLVKKERVLFIFPFNFLIITIFSFFLDIVKYVAFLNLKKKK
jgi:hypothetical protein